MQVEAGVSSGAMGAGRVKRKTGRGCMRIWVRDKMRAHGIHTFSGRRLVLRGRILVGCTSRLQR